MKKRYSLDSIIGKKSKIRMPRHVFMDKQEKISAILPANNAVSEPPFSTNVTMRKGDPIDLCDQVNDLSQGYNTDIPLRVCVSISTTETTCDVFETPVFQLVNMTHDLEDRTIESLQASKNETLLSNANFAIIKSTPTENLFTSDIISNTKSIYGSLLSYNCRRKKVKPSILNKPSMRFKNYINQRVIISSNKEKHLGNLKHFLFKAFNYEKKHRLPLLFERIDYFYDILEDWDEAYDHYFKNHSLTNIFDLLEYTLLALEYSYVLNNLKKNKKASQLLLQQKAILNIIQTYLKTTSKVDQDLLLPLKVFLDHDKNFNSI